MKPSSVSGPSSRSLLGANMTTLTFHLSRALAREWQSGDEVIVTELDHHGNVDPWRAVAQDRGPTIRSVPMDTATGGLDWNALECSFSPRTKLLAIEGWKAGHCGSSCALRTPRRRF
jgi:selenocysteine lyase/cysteine desulfurase